MLQFLDVANRIVGAMSGCVLAGAVMLNALAPATASCPAYSGCNGVYDPPLCDYGICTGDTCACAEVEGQGTCGCQ